MRNLLLILLLILVSGTAQAKENRAYDFGAFARIPVLHEGRVKPLDSFARAFLTMFSGKTVNDGFSASEWLAQTLFEPEAAYHRPVFNVPNPAVRAAIALPQRIAHVYSFEELSKAMSDHKAMIDTLLPKQGLRTLDPAQEQLVALYTDMLWYFEISRSVSLILPDFKIDDPATAKVVGVDAGKSFTYPVMISHRPAYLAAVKPYLNMKNPASRGEELLNIGLLLQRTEVDKQTRVLRVIPPQWGGEEWLSPWGLTQDGRGSPRATALLDQWEKTARAYRSGNAQDWQMQSAALRQLTMQDGQLRPVALDAEYIYNRANFFLLSLGFYIAAFLALLALGLGAPAVFYRASFALLACAALLHFAGLTLRIFIMARPPVGTLYESVIFVGLIVAAGSLLIEARTKQGLGLAIGSLAGAVLQFIGMKYAGEGDSMGMLVAVLNTNFWLATHVVAITIGYGTCLLAGLLAHVWLLQKIAWPDDRLRHELTAKSMLGAALVGLLFATMGTILGGIWADQSWGRFWGWDPKENGALLIVLWLLWLLHGRLSGMLKPEGFALGLALTTVVVTLSWFGVNLLNVGLHSYGFTNGIAANLGMFAAAEIALVAVCGWLLQNRSMSAA